MCTLRNTGQKSILQCKNVSHLVNTCTKLNFLIVSMVLHWRCLTCFRQTILSSLSAWWWPHPAAVNSFICWFIHSCIPFTKHLWQVCFCQVPMTMEGAGFPWQVHRQRVRDDLKAKKLQGMEYVKKVFFLALTFGCDSNFKHIFAHAWGFKLFYLH